MMISPEVFIEECKEKTYAELIQMRDDLIEEIREFEASDGDVPVVMMPSPDVIYQCNLQYLGKLCELISEKYIGIRDESAES